MPFYEPKTEEGRRIQAEIRLQKAREAERRTPQAKRHRVLNQHWQAVAPRPSSVVPDTLAEEAARLVSPVFLAEMQVRQSPDDPYTFFAKDPLTGNLVAWKSRKARFRAVWDLYGAIFPDTPKSK